MNRYIYLFYVLKSIKIKMPRIKRKQTFTNEYESSDDEYMTQIDNELGFLEDDTNFTKTSEPLLSVPFQTETSSNEDMIVRKRRKVRRLISDDEDSNEQPYISTYNRQFVGNDGTLWTNVTEDDNYYHNIKFSVGENVVGPKVPSSCTSPLEFFELFFTSTLLKKIVSETNAYAAKIISEKTLSKYSIWQNWKDVTESEMRAFIGVIINMGLVVSPTLESYWSRAFHLKMSFFRTIFSRKRFFQIFWSLHLETISPNTRTTRTRIERVSNFLDYLNQKFMENYIPRENLAIDESTVSFKGKINFLMYNPKKPTKWGLRVYVLADSKTSYLYSFVPYYGKITTDGLIRPDLNFTSRIVMHLYQNLRNSIPEAKGYHIFTDRFYTNPTLGSELLKANCFLTGTIMTNRKGLPEQIKKPKLAIGQKIAYRKGKTLVLAWRDKRVVTMFSTKHSSISQPERKRSKTTENATEKEINKPTIILDYNKNMGGVDVADQYATSYCFMRKTLKWWRKLFFWGLETSIVNSYILFNEYSTKENIRKMSHTKFRENLLMSLIKDFRAPTQKPGRLSTDDTIQRLDGKTHFIFSHTKHKDCMVCSNRTIKGGRKETTFYCDTCDRKPGLHPGECFKNYHTMKNYK